MSFRCSRTRYNHSGVGILADDCFNGRRNELATVVSAPRRRSLVMLSSLCSSRRAVGAERGGVGAVGGGCHRGDHRARPPASLLLLDHHVSSSLWQQVCAGRRRVVAEGQRPQTRTDPKPAPTPNPHRPPGV